MTNRLIRPGASYLSPGRPARAPRPAYDSVQTYPVTASTPPKVVVPGSGGGTTNWAPDTAFNAPGWVWKQVPRTLDDGSVVYNYEPFWTGAGIGNSTTFVNQPNTTTTTQQVSVVTHHPADPGDPGTPDTYVNNPPLGWTATARSISTIYSGDAQWKMDKVVTGVVVGLSATPRGTGGYGHIPHGLLMSGNRVVNARTGVQYTTWAVGDVFKVRVFAGGVTYLKNDASIGTEASLLPAQPLYMDAVFYGNMDTIDVPVLTETLSGSGAMTMPAMKMLGTDIDHYAAGEMVMPAMTMSGMFVDIMLMPAMRMFGSDTDGAFGAMVMPAMTMSAYPDDIPVDHLTEGFLIMPRMTMSGLSFTGQIASGDMVMPPMSLLGADYAYAGGDMVMPEMLMFAYPEDETEGYMFETALMPHVLDGPMEIIGFLYDSVVVAYTAASTVAIEGLMRDTVEVHTSWSTSQTLQALMLEIVRTGLVLNGSGPGIYSTDTDTWAVNIDNSGSTSYTNYGFNSFAGTKGKYYGANERGIFVLEGDDDDGEAIRASVSFGTVRFSKTEKKTVEQCYLGMSAQGNLFIKIIAEGREFIYKTRSFSPEIQQQRVTPGKGLRTNYVTLELYNENGEDFEVDTVKFVVADMKRRI